MTPPSPRSHWWGAIPHEPRGRGAMLPASPRQRGAIMVIALLALVLLACLVFFVFNVGRHVAARVETQNAADSAAMSGASWVARSFNTVAMNNVESARLISLAAVLDAMPQAVRFTLTDQINFANGVENQLLRGVGRGRVARRPAAGSGAHVPTPHRLPPAP